MDKYVLLDRFYLRCEGEKIINEFFTNIYTTFNKESAEEWLKTGIITLYLEEYEVVCSKADNWFMVYGEKFRFDFTYINKLCQTLLLDEV